MNIVLVTQKEPFYLRFFFKKFFEIYDKNKINILGIVIQPPFNDKNKFNTIVRAVNFYGLPGFLYMLGKFSLLFLLSLLESNLKLPFNASIESICHRHNIPVLPFKSVNSADFINFIQENNVELIVSVAASEIFRKKILNSPKFGCINIHSGPLPKYRGMMPNFWTLFNQEKFAYVTIHKMNRKLDDGPIIIQDKFPLPETISYNQLVKISKQFSAELLNKALDLIESGNVNYLPNDSKLASYYSFPTKKDMREFKRKGGKIFKLF